MSGSAPEPTGARSREIAVAVVAVLFLAAALRLPALGYGLPGTTHVDGFRFVEDAHNLATSTAPFTPDDYIYPGLLKLVLSVIYSVFGVESRTGLYLVPRILATLFDLGTVGLVFALARRLTGAYGATLAAALHAVAVIAVTSARTESADTAVTFFLTAALLSLTMPTLRPFHFVLGGVLVGCATGTKYSGAYGMILLPIAAWRAVRQGTDAPRAAGWSALGAGLAGCAFLAVTPWFIPRFDVYWRVMQIQAEVQRYGQIGHVQSTALDYLLSPAPTWEQPWLSTSLLGNMGPLVLAAGLASIAAALLGRLSGSDAAGKPTARILALYVVGYYVLISGAGHVKAIRYLLPVLPALWVLTGAGVARLAAHRPRYRLPVAPVAVVQAIVAILVLAYPAARTLPYLAASRRTMTNDLVVAWGRASLPRGATVLVSPFYLESLRQLDVNIVGLAGAATQQYRLNNTMGADTELKPLFRPELVGSMKRSGIEYVVLSSYFEGAVSDTEENRRWFPKTVAAYRAFRERLSAEGDLLFSVRGQADGRLGPDVDVYRLHLDGTSAPPAP